MDCSFQYNNRGEIVKVLDKQGNESILYKTIAKHPLIEDALATYKNIFTDKFKDLEENQINFTHRVGDATFSSFKEALQLAQENSTIKVGFEVDGKFTELLSITKNTELTNELGFIQAGLLNDLIATEKVLVGNSYRLQANGVSEDKKITSLDTLREQSLATLGSQSLIVDGITFQVQKTLGLNSYYSRGEAVNVEEADLVKMTDEEIRRKFDNPTEIIASRTLMQNIPLKRNAPLPTDVIVKEDSELVRNLTSLLNKMGISVVTMENYVKNYNIRNGVNPNAEALADITNQVVAITTGNETAENLLEETVHFIVEALPQTRIENILRNINKSEEYKESYEIQKAIYSEEYSGEELENIVNREILGKVIVNAINQTEEKAPTQQNFFENAKRLVSEFFQDIVNYFKPQYQVELENLTNDVQNLIASQDISSFDLGNFEGNERRFYNARDTDAIVKEALKNTETFLKLERDLSKTSKGNALNVKELRQAQAQLEKAYNTHAIAKINQVTGNTIKILEAALKDSKENNRTFDLSQEENVVYGNLTNGVKDGVGVLKELLQNKEVKTDSENILIKNLEDTVTKISELEAKRTVATNDSLEKMFRAVTTDRGLSEKEFQAMMEWASRAQNDINWVNSTFGTLANSSDPLANIYATKKTAMMNRASQKSHFETKALQAELRKLGYDEKYVATLVKDGYFQAELDLPRYLKDRDENFKRAFDKVFPDNKLTAEELLKKRREGALDWTLEQQTQIENEEDEANRAISEQRMLSSYYEELETKYETASEYTKSALRALNSQKNKIQDKARNENGVVDLSLLSNQDIAFLEILGESRKRMKSPVDFDGNMKPLLKFERDSDGNQKLISEVDIEELPVESRLAYDIFILDNNGNIEREEKERSKVFDEVILSKPTKDEQIKALNLNSNIGFSSKFWDGFKSSVSIRERLNSVKTDENEGDIDSLILDIEDVNSRQKALIRAHTRANNPSETHVENMSQLSKNVIKELEEEAERLREKSRELLKDTTVEINEDGISGANDSWNTLLIDSDLILTREQNTNMLVVNQMLNLAKKNATTKNANAITDAESNVRNFKAGKLFKVSKSVQFALDRQGLTKEDLVDDYVAAQFLKTFAEDRLLAYYKRFTPRSYIEFKNDLENDSVTMSEILSKDYEYLQITPNYSFNEEDTSMVNPDYIVSSRMGFAQPLKSKYQNKEFASKFGKVIRDKNGMYVSTEKNEKEFEAYKTVMNFRFNQIDTMDGGANYNAYITPQIRKQSIERWMGSIAKINGRAIKDAFEDFTTFTEDDQAQGDITFGAGNKIIPRQYFSKLENQTDITSDVFNALILTNNAANLYESRVKFYGDFMAIQDVAKNRQTLGTNKETSATNRFKTIESAIDNDIFGISQVVTDTVLGHNTAKIVDSLGTYLRLKGLGASIIIPATGALTSTTKQFVENLVGQYVNKDSFSRGRKEYNKQIAKATSEIGKLHSVSELNVKGEYWQAFDLESRLYGSSFNGTQRFLSKSSMILYQAANYGVYAKNLYNVLHDYRVVDGKVVKFTDFKRNERVKNYDISEQEIQDKWKKENIVINDLHTVNEAGQVIWNKARLKELLKDNEGNEYSEEALDEEILKIADDIRIQIKNLNVRSDMALSPEDKVAGQRHYLIRFLLSFKSFMIPLFEERFKSTGFNSQSRQLESGSYSGIYELGRDILKEWKTNGGNFMRAFQNQYNGVFTEQKTRIEELKKIQNKTVEQEQELKQLTEDLVKDMELVDLRHSSMRRLAIDLLVVNSLIALMMLVRGAADDDKDNYSLQLAALLVQRLTNETNAASLNITSGYYETISSPLSGFRILTDVSKLPKAYEDGTLPETLAKGWLPFFSAYTQMQNPEIARDNMTYYTEVQADNYVLSPVYHLMNSGK